mmetsp:Transcript_17574/g.39388  ORF Transcript_17574/g.39388 Transcript_17574/m.39388 type:complete len:109 (-) Transcript_17574:15-341(-)
MEAPAGAARTCALGAAESAKRAEEMVAGATLATVLVDAGAAAVTPGGGAGAAWAAGTVEAVGTAGTATAAAAATAGCCWLLPYAEGAAAIGSPGSRVGAIGLATTPRG